MELSIIIVSFNTKDLLRNLLQTLPAKKIWEVIVVDNASGDGTPAMVESEFPKVKLIKNSQNLGFAKANNQALRLARGRYLLLLNSDTLVEAGALEKLVGALRASPRAGIAAPQLLNPDRTIQVQGGYLPNLVNLAFWMFFLDDLPWFGQRLYPYHINDRAFFTKPRSTGWVAGTALLLKSELLQTVGFFNEDFFMYGEDVEYCRRASKQGYRIILVPDARIIHFGQGSSGGKSAPARIGEYRALIKIYESLGSPCKLAIVKLLLKVGALLRMLVFGILQGRESYEAYKKAYRVV